MLCGCSGIPGKLLIMEANYKNSRGMYNEAITPYLKALDYADAAPYAEYGLGSVYFALGEEQAALDRFAKARKALEKLPPSENSELHYRIHYNTGVVLFSAQDFAGAANSFREALRVDGRRIDAKRNLELCILSLSRENLSVGIDEYENESMLILFDFIRQKELNQWRSREWTDEEEITGPDY
ncbi:MAG: tetratricopeptide repeat protein [Treponema sp.]|nr:tetratricopeptide repeat protein [Treponema sp.]